MRKFSERRFRIRRNDQSINLDRDAVWKVFGIALTALALLLGAAFPASAAELMRVTFVRHGESAGNASGLIDTSTPGPVLTQLGQQQAQAVVGRLGDNNYDGIYASTMVRTQLTAAPMSQYLGLPIQVLPGLQEIEAGVFEGTPESRGRQRLREVPARVDVPGHAVTFRTPGLDRRQRVRRAGRRRAEDHLRQRRPQRGRVLPRRRHHVLDDDERDEPHHGAEDRTAEGRPLDNTDYVVIEGNAEDGWTLVNWNGQQFGPEPTLGAEVSCSCGR